jgi:hypothetical protein
MNSEAGIAERLKLCLTPYSILKAAKLTLAEDQTGS